MNLAVLNERSDASNGKMMKFLYSYGGKIVIRRADDKLRYVGGHTRILAVNRSISFEELILKFSKLCGGGSSSSSSVRFKCKLPEDNLDLLVSIKCDEDLANIIEEYERFSVHTQNETKIRAILFLILPIQYSMNCESPNPALIIRKNDNYSSQQSVTTENSPPTVPSTSMNVAFRLINGFDAIQKGVCKRFLTPPPSPSRFAVDVKNLRSSCFQRC